MPQRDHYIPGVPCWVDTSHPDPGAASEFYGDLFGWQFENTMPPGEIPYFIARLNGGEVAGVGGIPPGAPPMAMWNTYVSVASADDAAAAVQAAGGTVIAEPFDIGDAGRMAVFADPEGAVFSVWQANQMIGATLVNDPGSLTFNGLHTRDVAAATAFYGSVFGWTTLALGPGAEAWTLPGYGDDLERVTPGLRKMMADAGGPPGFEDVVASIQPIVGDQPDVPAHWSVTFSVADADAIAARAAELGGTVVVPPFDAPWSRQTVIDDPQGARFIASKFAPENKDLTG